jgi:hypothetical protein
VGEPGRAHVPRRDCDDRRRDDRDPRLGRHPADQLGWVNGIDAVSSDGFATFFAEVPLSTGAHDVVVAVFRPNLPVQLFTFEDRVTRVDPIVVDVVDALYDAANDRLLLADRAAHAIVAVDVATGARTSLSDFERGTGFNMIHPISLAVDATGKTAWVLDEESDLVLAVDLVHGDRTALSGAGFGSGPVFGRPVGVAFDPTFHVVLVADADLAAVFTVDVTNGKRTILSDATHGSGPMFSGRPRRRPVRGARPPHGRVAKRALRGRLRRRSADRVGLHPWLRSVLRLPRGPVARSRPRRDPGDRRLDRARLLRRTRRRRPDDPDGGRDGRRARSADREFLR